MLIGWVPFVFAFVIPVIVSNVVVMSFILTNHCLSPATEINDPLVNSLSVTGPRWFEWLTLNFGYHVEHHLFPSMRSRHARTIRALAQAQWPDRYQQMPLLAAVARLHRTGRVYKNDFTLSDPKSGGEWATLLPRSGGTKAPEQSVQAQSSASPPVSAHVTETSENGTAG